MFGSLKIDFHVSLSKANPVRASLSYGWYRISNIKLAAEEDKIVQ